jgi:hypothetical protein
MQILIIKKTSGKATTEMKKQMLWVGFQIIWLGVFSSALLYSLFVILFPVIELFDWKISTFIYCLAIGLLQFLVKRHKKPKIEIPKSLLTS